MHFSEGQLSTHSFKPTTPGAHWAAGSGTRMQKMRHSWASCLFSHSTPLRPSQPCTTAKLLQAAPPQQAQGERCPRNYRTAALLPWLPPCTKGKMIECVFLIGRLRPEWDGTSKTECLAHSKSSIKVSCYKYSNTRSPSSRGSFIQSFSTSLSSLTEMEVFKISSLKVMKFWEAAGNGFLTAFPPNQFNQIFSGKELLLLLRSGPF